MLESVRKSHPRKTPPSVIDLTKDLPSPRELESSYIKLRDLCTPGNERLNFMDVIRECNFRNINALCLYLIDTVRQFWYQDNHFYSLLENSKWLLYVSNCLQKAVEAARLLNNNVSVVLQGSWLSSFARMYKI